jgi:hypothetical protein
VGQALHSLQSPLSPSVSGCVFFLPCDFPFADGDTGAKPLLLPQNISAAVYLKMYANYCFGKKPRHLSLYNINNFYYY